ncbi:hypothetical protein [Pseudomonas frederiksbergensis]|nr:hypothetical protein [Pseudomonas frederiksbergensis]
MSDKIPSEAMNNIFIFLGGLAVAGERDQGNEGKGDRLHGFLPWDDEQVR